MPVNVIMKEVESKMSKAVEHLQGELKAVRAGRASTALVDNIKVDYYGNPSPLKQIATMSTPQADQIVIKPFDPASLKDIEKAIKNSDLSIAPMMDGKIIRLTIPPLSEERRNQLTTQVKQMGEQTKVSVRNIRRDANKQLDDEQKAKLISEDDRDSGKKDIDELTKKATAQIDVAVKAKTADVMSD